MRMTDRRFLTAWWTLLFLIGMGCMIEGRNGEQETHDMIILALPLLSTQLCHRVKPRVAFYNLIVMIACYATVYLLVILNCSYRTGPKWWFVSATLMILTIIHSIALLIFSIISTGFFLISSSNFLQNSSIVQKISVILSVVIIVGLFCVICNYLCFNYKDTKFLRDYQLFQTISYTELASWLT